MSGVIATVAGALLVAFVLREVFHMIFHPGGRGGASMAVFRLVWAVTARGGERPRTLAGPTAVVLVIALWAGGLIAGFALIYWPALPGGFIFAEPLAGGERDGFLTAVYLSWVTQATLGYGDIAPDAAALRLVAPLQATVGFALFTAAITWVLSIYPALQRQRAAASFAQSLRRADERRAAEAPAVPASTQARRLERLAQAFSGVGVDFIQYPSTFYFAAGGRSISLAAALPYVRALARADGYAEEAQPAADELAATLDELAETLAAEHLGIEGEGTDAVLAAYRRHQRAETDGAER